MPMRNDIWKDTLNAKELESAISTLEEQLREIKTELNLREYQNEEN